MNDETDGRRFGRPSRGLMIGVGVAVILAGALAWRLGHSAGAGAMDKDANVPPLVTVVVPALGNVTSTVSLTGEISAQNDMPIGVEGDGGQDCGRAGRAR